MCCMRLSLCLPGDGLCGYHSLAYALTGDKNRHAEVVEDILKAFMFNPHIVLFRTKLGKQANPNLSFYECELRTAAVMGRASKGYWMEEGHIVTFSMMFDVTVYVYHPGHRQWYAYGSGGRRGYVCLLATGGHFDVLQGMWPAKPAVPHKAIRQGPNRSTMTWNVVGGVNPAKYEYSYVNTWHSGEAELVSSGSSSSPIRCSYAEMVKRRSPVSVSATSESVSQHTVRYSGDFHQDSSVMTTAVSHECSVCSAKFLSRHELRTHSQKVHRDGADTAIGDSSSHKTEDAGGTACVRAEETSVNSMLHAMSSRWRVVMRVPR